MPATGRWRFGAAGVAEKYSVVTWRGPQGEGRDEDRWVGLLDVTLIRVL